MQCLLTGGSVSVFIIPLFDLMKVSQSHSLINQKKFKHSDTLINCSIVLYSLPIVIFTMMLSDQHIKSQQ